MMKGTAGWVTLCLGAGSYSTSLDMDKTDETLPGQVSWIGEEGVVLVPVLEDTGAEATPLKLLTHQPVVFQGLRFELPLELTADSITLRDVELGGFTLTAEETPALSAKVEEELVIDGLSVSAIQVDDVALRLEGETITIADLDYRESRSVLGAHIELRGEASIAGLLVEDTIVLMNEPGRALMTAYKDLSIEDSRFATNQSNGPALGAAESLEASDLVITDHRSTWTGALTLFGSATLSRLELTDNVGGEGALALYPVGPASLVLIEQSDFGAEDLDNDPCDISLYGGCIRSDLEKIESLLCDQSGCR